MDKEEKLLAEYFKSNPEADKQSKGPDCPDSRVLAEYLRGLLDSNRREAVEGHIRDCRFCLSQISIAFQAQSIDKKGGFAPVSQELINKTKALLGISADKRGGKHPKLKKMKKHLFLLGAIVFFVLSFLIPKYFIQFLVAALILGIRWAFESEGGRTLIMVLDSWRHHSHDKDDDISRRLKNRF